MIEVNQLLRVFTYKTKGKEITLDDPEASMSPDEVLNFYTATYGELVSASIEGPQIKDDAVHYRFVSTIGTKG